jgi:acetyltransferase-like isoleucine patch superfamily enzyme
MSETFRDEKRNVSITAARLEIAGQVSFGRDIDVRVKGVFALGHRSHLGQDVQIRGNNVRLGADLFHSQGLRVGGGGRQHPGADLTLGDRCTIHDNFINVCEPVVIGDDVGLSPGVSILTHGYWLSVLEGFPATFAGVRVGNGVIVGYRSVIMMGVTIGDNAVIGAQSVVTKSLEGNAIHAGNPARFIRKVVAPDEATRRLMLDRIIDEYRKIAAYHDIAPDIRVDYPKVRVNGCEFDVLTLAFEGVEDDETDDFRDYVRKWGLRFFSDRHHRSRFEF